MQTRELQPFKCSSVCSLTKSKIQTLGSSNHDPSSIQEMASILSLPRTVPVTSLAVATYITSHAPHLAWPQAPQDCLIFVLWPQLQQISSLWQILVPSGVSIRTISDMRSIPVVSLVPGIDTAERAGNR